jgi:hypothetical protein
VVEAAHTLVVVNDERGNADDVDAPRDVSIVHLTGPTFAARPDNAPSCLLVAQYGFRKVGEQWDDEDGLEFVYEVAAGHAH